MYKCTIIYLPSKSISNPADGINCLSIVQGIVKSKLSSISAFNEITNSTNNIKTSLNLGTTNWVPMVLALGFVFEVLGCFWEF